ncbi:hypothetical protein [Candidatus Tisiphia endosymbiont of Empis tessellata]|uniref:hypothetical protein n=1 Tax=Candidatus Tisiphia endosymbiont of Empis tessellata TaxID=3066259 RepID=UPI00313DBE0B
MELNLQLIIKYINSFDFYKVTELISWFNKNDQDGKFKLWLMNNNEKRVYAAYLYIIGQYGQYGDYRSSNNTAIGYLVRAKEVLNNVQGYDTLKFNVFFNLSMSNIVLGDMQEVEKNTQIIERMFNEGSVDKIDIPMLYFVKARLFFYTGKIS